MKFLLTFFFAISLTFLFAQDSLKITYYNLLNFPSSQQDRVDTLKKILDFIESKGLGSKKINYKLRDWGVSRQRYWGEPFPVYYKNNIPYLVKCDDAVTLPEIDKYLPTETGDPPLARAKKTDWNIFEGDRMDTNIMPGWAGSSWYFLRFMDANNQNEFVSRKKSDYWGQVDLYIGGAEHAVGHLLYSRFFMRALEFKNTNLPLYNFFLNKWYVDELYDALFVNPAKKNRLLLLEKR